MARRGRSADDGGMRYDPDHVHFIVINTGGITPLGDAVQWFKTMSTNAYIHGVRTAGWPPFAGRLWQRNHFESMLTGRAALDATRQYIAQNPAHSRS